MADLRIAAVLRHLEAPAAEGSDAELLRRFARRRDRGSFEALVRRHGAFVRFKLLGLLVLAITAGAGVLARPAVSDAPAQPPKAERPAERRDRHGDPLPPGAVARLGTTRLRSTASALALAGDGKTILSVAGGRTLGRWDLETGRLRDEIHLAGAFGEEGWPARVVSNREAWFAPNGSAVAVQDGEGLGVYDTATGKRLHRIDVTPHHVAVAPRGRAVAVSEYLKSTGIIRTWDLDTGKEQFLAALPSYANDLAFSPDGKRLYAAVDNHSLRCWDVASRKQLWQNDSRPSRVTVSADGRIVATNSYLGGPVHLFDADTGKHTAALGSERLWSTGLAFSPDGALIAQGANPGVLVWDIKERKLRYRLDGAGPAVAFTADGKSLVTLGTMLQRWDAATGKPLYADTAAHGHVGAVATVAFAPDGRTVASSGADGTVRVWDLADGSHRVLRKDAPSHNLREAGSFHVYSAAPLEFTPDGKHLLTDVAAGELALTDVATGKVARRFALPKPKDDFIVTGAARLTRDGRTVLALGRTHKAQVGGDIVFEAREPLRAWDAATGREVLAVTLTHGVVSAAEFSPDGRLLFVPEEGRLVHLRPHGERTLAVGRWDLSRPSAFSPDGLLVAAVEPNRISGPARAVRVYETLSGRLLARFQASLEFCRDVAFSPDGQFVAALGSEALFVWEVATGRRVLHLPAKGRVAGWTAAGFGYCLAFAPDGQSLATGLGDSTVVLWDLAPAWKQLTPPPGPVDAEACWKDLAAEDPRSAYAAIAKLASVKAKALPLLRKHLKPVIIEKKWLADRLADLDSRKFAEREAAVRELARVAEAIEGELHKALESAKSLETRDRLRRLLAGLKPGVPSADELRQVRGVALLERIGGDEARAILRDLAGGAADHRLTRTAAGALERLRER